VTVGEPVPAITEAAEALDADLVVMGIHRPRPFWDMFSGTTMERVVRTTRRTVLVVKDPADHPYKAVLCGIDLSPSCVAAATAAAELAPGAAFSTFHAVHVPYRGLIAPGPDDRALTPFIDAAKAELDGWWPASGMPEEYPRPEPVAASVTQAFEAMKRRADPDLLAIGAHGRPVLAPTLLGSFTEQVLREPPCDVILKRL
jgi:nucleotide-binding universal stress UspA family protein